MKTLVLAIFLLIGGVGNVKADIGPLDQWVRELKPLAVSRLYSAISPAGAAKGAVYASPSRHEPDYYYHWVRDAALVLREVYELRGSDRHHADRMLREFIHFSRRNQLTPNPSGGPGDRGLGEVKFNMDGSAFMAAWGRPQNDGPALRAFLLAMYATKLLSEGQQDYIHREIYRPEIPATTVLKADLEYVAYHWRETSFDLWEESRGDHFYTRMAQWRAMEEGAALAHLLGDHGAGEFYSKVAGEILNSLNEFWSEQDQILRVTIRHTGGIDYKHSGVDVANVLAVIQVGKNDGPFSIRDSRVIRTALAIEDWFRGIYPVNRMQQTSRLEELGVAIGRYPEDTYDGYRVGRIGNPWFLTTHALAEFYYRLAAEARDSGFTNSREFREVLPRLIQGDLRGRSISDRLRERGDAFFRRSQYHADRQGHLAEQFSRFDGLSRGAPDLTWSYASFLSAERARSQLSGSSRVSRFLPRSEPSNGRRK